MLINCATLIPPLQKGGSEAIHNGSSLRPSIQNLPMLYVIK